jgi:hypothetical protein
MLQQLLLLLLLLVQLGCKQQQHSTASPQLFKSTHQLWHSLSSAALDTSTGAAMTPLQSC